MNTILFWGAKEYPVGYKHSDNLAGGIETSFQRIIAGLKNKIKIKIITRKFKGQQSIEKQEGIEIIRIKTPFFAKGFFYNFYAFFYLLFRRCDYDKILTSGIMATFFAGILKIFKFKKFKLYCRWDTPAYLSKTKLLYPLEKLTYSLLVDKFLLKTEFESSRIKKLYSIKKINYKIVGFGIDYKPANANYKCIPIKKFAYIGRLDKIKNIFLMMDSFSKLNSNLELNIYGDGPLKNKIKTYISKNKIKNIKYQGFTSNVRGALLDNDCLLLLSKTEGLPNVVLEAMALKKPIIMSDIGLFSRDIIYSVQLTNSTEIARNIQSFLDNKRLQSTLVNNAYNYSLKNFNYENMIENYKNILE
ncbi:MAG: glycosyltransferase [Candidatus ainarchaeum sp.]|nr:glycosyltransferase [Candidatus ainarchaeum sp.]